MWQRIKQLKEERGEKLAAMKALLTKAETEKRSLTAEEDTQFNTLNTDAEQRKVEIERYETAQRLETELAAKPGEQRVGRDAIDTPEQQADEQAKEQRAQFHQYLRGG